MVSPPPRHRPVMSILSRHGDVGDHVQRGLGPGDEVVVQRDPAHALPSGVSVGDREHGVPVADRPLDEAAIGGQVHDVVLIDPGRAGQHRVPRAPQGSAARMDQLHQVVGEHDLPGGGGHVLAQREGPGVNLLNRPWLCTRSWGSPGPRDEAGAAGVERPLQGRGVGGQEIRRAERVEQEARCESGFPVAHLVTLARREQVRGELPGRQVGLAQRGERRVVVPEGGGRRSACPGPGQGWRHIRAGRPGQRERADPGQVRPELQVRLPRAGPGAPWPG